MANGDAAAAQGFTPVAPGEDFRLGYDGINRAADFAAGRVRYSTVASAAAMAAIGGAKRGDRCFRTDQLIEYRYNGTAWKPWDSEWNNYPAGIGQVAFQTVKSRHRFHGGVCRTEFSGVNVNATGNGAMTVGLPFAADVSSGMYGAGRAVWKNSDGGYVLEAGLEFTGDGQNVQFLYLAQINLPRSYYLNINQPGGPGVGWQVYFGTDYVIA